MQHDRQSFGIHFLLLLFAFRMVTITGRAESGVSVAPQAALVVMPICPVLPILPRQHRPYRLLRRFLRDGAFLPA